MSVSRVAAARSSLLKLSHELGREDRNLAILGEGNVSARISPTTFLVKASGSNLATLSARDVTTCRIANLVALLEGKTMTDSAVDEALFSSRVNSRMKKPSVEAIFHAWVLTLSGVNFVGHTHPVAVNRILCSKRARTFAKRRLFPDEIVCCGSESVFVSYTDPGFKLAQAIRTEVVGHIRRRARPPRLILLENHGLIALGSTPAAVLATTLMAVKAAEIFAGAVAIGGAPRFLSPTQVTRIAGRPDEHHRQKVLGL